MSPRLRADDPRLVALGLVAALSAALWLAAASAMGGSDVGFIEICRAAFGGELSTEGRARLSALAAVLPPEGLSPRLIAETWAMWTLMMAAMMLPSLSAMLATYTDIARLEAKGAARGVWLRLTLFIGAYILVWAGFSLAMALAQLGLRASALFSHDGATAGPLAGGALLILAGAYQFSPVKQACLTKCRQPMQFLMARWRAGPGGAARLGLAHGLYCLGCCAGLMALMFVFGAMNIWWMAAIAIYCAAEKLAPGAENWGLYAGGLMALAGVAMIGTQL